MQKTPVDGFGFNSCITIRCCTGKRCRFVIDGDLIVLLNLRGANDTGCYAQDRDGGCRR